ncbi:MAG: hypothetical protein ACTS8Z_02780 [Candidatus Limnocylindrales bacterium]
MSPAARQTIDLETTWTAAQVELLDNHRFRFGDIAASRTGYVITVDTTILRMRCISRA